MGRNNSKRKTSATWLTDKEPEYLPPKRIKTPTYASRSERSTRARTKDMTSPSTSNHSEHTLANESPRSSLNSSKVRGQPTPVNSLSSSRSSKDCHSQHGRETNSSSTPQKRSVRFGSALDRMTQSRASLASELSPTVSSSSPKNPKSRLSSSSSSRRRASFSASSRTRKSSSSPPYSETSTNVNALANCSPRHLRIRIPHQMFERSLTSVDDDSFINNESQRTETGRCTRKSQLPVSSREHPVTRQSSQRKRRFAPPAVAVAAPVSMTKRGCPLTPSTDAQVCQHPGDEAFDEIDEDVENKQPDGRRYPIRARRNTAVYQVETNTQSNHAPHRNWLSGTGFENYRRRNRHKSYRHLEHCGSSTPSSSSDSSSDASSPTRQKPRPLSRRQPSGHHAPLEVDADEVRFARRCTKSILNARSELLPINLNREDAQVKSSLSNRLLSGTNLADIEPMSIDDSVGFEQVGGHEKHIDSLKECILLPLMYPEVFSEFGIEPPRGVLFSGPPGTGKTLLARALANECGRLVDVPTKTGSQLKPVRRQIAFFMRKGADCLSKWVGESERQLRLLFDQAYRMRPSIIFFDEIDGLAPVRSSRQDQIHSSIVSTLLSLMDGLDNRAEVVVIGATNRPDAIDPALRRPGRFDREFVFQLPPESVRLRILQVHTAKWEPKLDADLLKELAHATNNFSGADLKALVTEACLSCLRRRYPQVYSSQVKLALDRKYLVVTRSDWLRALRIVRPSNDRSDVDCSVGSLSPSASALASTRRSPLQSLALRSLLAESVDRLTNWLIACLYPGRERAVACSADQGPAPPGVRTMGRRALLVHGDLSPGLMSAVWHRLESAQVFTLDFTNLIAFPTSVGICPEAAIAQIVSAVRRAVTSAAASLPSYGYSEDDSGVTLCPVFSLPAVILYLPGIDSLVSRMPRQTSVYLVDRLVGLLSDCHHANGSQDVANPHQPPSLQYQQHQSGGLPLLLVSTIQRPRSTASRIASSNHLGTREDMATLGKEPARGRATGHLVNDLSDREVTNPRNAFGTLSPNGVNTVKGYNSHQPVVQANGELPDDQYSSPGPEELSSASDSDDDRPEKSAPTGSTCSRRLVRSLLSRLFQPSSSTKLCISTPNLTTRKALFGILSDIVFQHANEGTLREQPTVSDCRRSVNDGRAPTPPPVGETANGVGGDAGGPVTCRPQYSPTELLSLEREEAQLFRRLRQVLRRVVAHLARHRRFAVFTRPVQADEVPDYYEVIKQPMDLGSIRDKIDAHQYTDVTSFMQDIELVYRNALEYNPANVPRSREIRSRASEFWDEACLQLEEELHPVDLDERCRSAAEAQAARRDTLQPSAVSAPAGSANLSVSTATTCTVKAPPPLPLGSRYSRRLHGEDPVLASNDIIQLEVVASVRSRKDRASQSVSTTMSVEKQADGPQPREPDADESSRSALFTDEATPAVPAANGFVASFAESPSLSETVNNYVLDDDSALPMTLAKSPGVPASESHHSLGSPVAKSVSLSTSSSDSCPPRDAQPRRDCPGYVGQTGDNSEATIGEADHDSLREFCNGLADKTQGWPSDRLLCLYHQLALLCQHHCLCPAEAAGARMSSRIPELITDLFRVYTGHCVQETSEHIL